jgi:hypothetical protein
MTALEDALAAAFAERAAQALPVPVDLARRAIVNGRVQRRRQLAGASAIAICAFVATALVVVGGSPDVIETPAVTSPVAQASPSAEPLARKPPPVTTGESASPVPMMARIPVDFVTGGRLHLRDGRALTLALTAVVEQVYRAEAGFVVVETSTLRRAWFVDGTTGAQVMLFDKATWVAVAGDGSGRLAWVSGRDMYFRNSSQEAGQVRRTEAPADGGPIGFVGDAVLLADPVKGGAGFGRHDLWFPAKGDYRPTWVDFFAVFGVRSGGRELVAARSTARKDICISFATIEDLVVQQAECDLLDQPPKRGWVSPSGRWLVVVDARGAQVFDLSVKRRTAARLGAVVQDVRADATWLDPDTVALHDADRLLVLPMQGPGHATEYLLPADAVVVRE